MTAVMRSGLWGFFMPLGFGGSGGGWLGLASWGLSGSSWGFCVYEYEYLYITWLDINRPSATAWLARNP